MDFLAVGDIIVGMGVDLTQLVFQPAASVSIMISAIGLYNAYFDLYDGTTNSVIGSSGTTSAIGTHHTGKIFINNSVYLQLRAPSAEAPAYSGIQIQ